MTLSKEERAARRAQEHNEDRAKLEAQLQETIDLVTAMFWNLESGECLTNEQIAACRYDRILGCLCCRMWDYAVYCNQRGRVNRIAHDDAVSVYLDYESKQLHVEVEAWRCGEVGDITHSQKLRAVALQGHPRARTMRRRYAVKRAS